MQAWNGDADCLNCSLRGSALFNGLTAEDFELIHYPVEQVTLNPGDVLYTEGEPGHYLFTVRSGLMKLVQHLADGSQRIVRLSCSTDVLGLEMLLSDHYEHEAIVLRTTELCRYPRDAVERLSQSNPVVYKNLMMRWQKALSAADAWITQLSTGSAKKRLAHLLLLLSKDNDSAECFLFSREDIGSILSTTTETASRTLSEFKRLGLVEEISHNHLRLDIPGLTALISA